MSRSGPAWWVVLPLNSTRVGKSRIDLPPHQRRDLAIAMYRDTVAATLATARVEGVVVVCADARDVGLVHDPRVAGMVEPPGSGLNAAIRTGAAEAWTFSPGCRVAALPTDLPALHSADLDVALGLAAAHPCALVADEKGTGTTLLTGTFRSDLQPRYGEGSRARHVAHGAVELPRRLVRSVGWDVDVLGDLDPVASDVGRHTAEVLEAIGANGRVSR